METQDSAPYAILGDVLFRCLMGWEHFEATRAANYAEHAVIEGKPRLQWTGDGLETLNIVMGFHVLYCDPDFAMRHLRRRLADHKAMALVLVNGFYRGRYVLTELSEGIRHTDPQGNTIAMEVRATLKEWVGTAAASDTGVAISTNGASLCGSVKS